MPRPRPPHAPAPTTLRTLRAFARISVLASLLAPSTEAWAAPPASEAALSGAVDAQTLTRIAVERNPGLKAVERRAAATGLRGDAESRMPPPEVEVTVQQIPLSKPYDVPGAQMIMFGVRQPIPAPGSLSAMREMRSAQADEQRASIRVLQRELEREVGHAFVDYWSAAALIEVHQRNLAEAERVLAFAKARYVSGGPLADMTQAEVEVAMIGASIATQKAGFDAAQARLNGLMLRAPDAPLGAPVEPPLASVAEDVATLVRRVTASRPEIRVARSQQTTMIAEARVAEREADWPMMSVGAFYYTPTRDMPGHAYGASFMSTLPWAWGRASSTARAGRAMAASASDEIADVEARARTEIATYAGAVRASEQRFRALRDNALPASARAVSAAASGYESGRSDILMLLSARRAVVEIETEILDARAMIEHGMVDLDWAAGATVARRPLTSANSPK